MKRFAIGAALVGALVVPTGAQAATHDGTPTHTMGKAFAKKDAYDRAEMWISRRPRTWDWDDPVVRVVRKSRKVVVAKVTITSFWEWSECLDDPVHPDPNWEECRGAIHDWIDVDRTTFKLRYRSWSSWGNPYRLDTTVVGDRSSDFERHTSSIDPRNKRFGGTAIRTTLVRTIDKGITE